MIQKQPLTINQIISHFESIQGTKNAERMARFGVTPKKTYGITIPQIRSLAKTIGTNHELSLELWKHDIRETRILAGLVGDPLLVTDNQMEDWVVDFDYWEICDSIITELFCKTPLAWDKAKTWIPREEEYVRRAGFVMIAKLAFSDKTAPDTQFTSFFPALQKYATDERNMVKKAVNWALRQTGKRNLSLNEEALMLAEQIQQLNSKSARWIASDAIRELQDPKIIANIQRKKTKLPVTG